MTEAPTRKIPVAFLHSKNNDEIHEFDILTQVLRSHGEAIGTQLRVNDAVDAQSIFEGILWFLEHPVSSGIISGTVVLAVDRWLSKPDRRLEVQFEGKKITANSVDELRQILAALPPPTPSRILQDGEMMLDGEIMPFDAELWEEHKARWIEETSAESSVKKEE